MMRKNRHILISFFSVLLFYLPMSCSSPSSPTTSYYVSTSGNDASSGTSKEPFKTIARVNSLKLKPGDTVLFKGGETFDGTLSLVLQGTAEMPVVISSYEEGTATLHGGDKEAVIISGRYFKLHNIHAKGNGRKTGNTTNGISLVEAFHGLVENCKAEGFQKSGLDLYNCQHVVVKKVHAFDNGFGGINVGGADRTKSKNILIQDCNAENNPGDPTNLDNHSGNGILVGLSDSVTVDHCTATNNGWDMPRIGNGPVGIWAYESSHLIIQYCISYRNRTAKGAKDGGGFDLDGGVTHSIIQYCLSYENEGAGYGLFQYAGASLWYNNIVRYCLSINDATATEGSGGIFMWNGAADSTQLADCLVHNNVVYSTYAPAIEFEPNSLNKNFSFYNNIFIGTGEIIHGPTSGERFNGNIWWNAEGEIKFRGYKTLEAWSRATGQEKLKGEITGRQIDPMLMGPFVTDLTDPYKLQSLTGYTLKNGSPILDSGLDLPDFFKIPLARVDLFGTPLPQSKNREPGVYEQPEK